MPRLRSSRFVNRRPIRVVLENRVGEIRAPSVNSSVTHVRHFATPVAPMADWPVRSSTSFLEQFLPRRQARSDAHSNHCRTAQQAPRIASQL